MSANVRCYRFEVGTEAHKLKKRVRALFPGLLVQAVDSGAASNENFLEMIGAQTREASAAKSSLARKTELDLLLRLGGTTQISEAIEKVGARHGRPFLLIVVGDAADLAKLEKGLAAGWSRLPRGSLTIEDFERIEKAALLDAERA